MTSLRLGTLLLLLPYALACSSVVPAPVAPPIVKEAPKKPMAPAAVVSAAPAAVVVVPSQREFLGLELRSSPSAVVAGKKGELLLRLRVKGLALEEKKRPPLNIALVVDTSGSMDGVAIERTRDACATMVDALQTGDAFSIVTFGSSAQILVPASRVSDEMKAVAKKAIQTIRAEGTTDMAGGLRVGVGEAQKLMDPTGINRVVLLGDGVPNDAKGVVAIADHARTLRIPLTSLGLGADFDETLMTDIAKRSGGTYHFIDDAARVSKVFTEEISKLERIVAKGAYVDLVPGPGIAVVETIGVTPVGLGRGVRVQIGDVAEGQVKDVIVKLAFDAHRDGSKIELLDAIAHYAPPNGDGELLAKSFSSVASTSDIALTKDGGVEEIEHQAARLKVADNIVRAIALARSGDVVGARRLLDATQKLATDGGKRFKDADLGAKTKEIADLKKTVASLAPRPEVQVGMNPPRPMRMKTFDEVSPAAAMKLRETHASAMQELQ